MQPGAPGREAGSPGPEMLIPEPESEPLVTDEPEQLQDTDGAVGFGDAAGLWSAASGLQSLDPAPAHVVAVESTSSTTGPMLREMVTVLVFTSAVRSDPSLCLLATTVGSFRHCPGLQGCRVVFVCDGWQATTTAIDRRGNLHHCPGKRIVETERARLYAERVDALQAAILRSHEGGEGAESALEWIEPHWEILRLPHWLCYGGALRVALDVVNTPLVLVVQHDFAFVSPIDLQPVAGAMLAHTFVEKQASLASACPSVQLYTSQGGPCPSLNYCGLLKKAQVHYAMSVRSRSALDIGDPISISIPGRSALVLDRLPQLYDSTHLAGAQHAFSNSHQQSQLSRGACFDLCARMIRSAA